MHAKTFLIPRGTNDLYAFGTEVISELREETPGEICPVGYRKSTDNGYTLSEFKRAVKRTVLLPILEGVKFAILDISLGFTNNINTCFYKAR